MAVRQWLCGRVDEVDVYVEDLDIPVVKITENAQHAIDRAVEEARRREHSLLTSEHVLYALAQVEWDLLRTGRTKANSRKDVMVINLNLWTNAMIWLLVVSGLYATYVIGAMTLDVLIWLEAAALILGLVAVARRKTSRPV